MIHLLYIFDVSTICNLSSIYQSIIFNLNKFHYLSYIMYLSSIFQLHVYMYIICIIYLYSIIYLTTIYICMCIIYNHPRFSLLTYSIIIISGPGTLTELCVEKKDWNIILLIQRQSRLHSVTDKLRENLTTGITANAGHGHTTFLCSFILHTYSHAFPDIGNALSLSGTVSQNKLFIFFLNIFNSFFFKLSLVKAFYHSSPSNRNVMNTARV